MIKLLNAVQALQADNPLGLPLVRSVRDAVPVKGTNVRVGIFHVITERDTVEFARNLMAHPALRFLEGALQCAASRTELPVGTRAGHPPTT